MSVDTITSDLWKCHRADDYYPKDWLGKLSIDEAYQVQLGILFNKTEAGEKHAGWKVGLTADVVREIYDAKEPVFGYLLESGSFRTGHRFDFNALYPPLMETEILITLGTALDGPNADRESARAAIATIAPAFEVPERRGGGLEVDFPLGLVDNVSQRAWVWGEEIPLDQSFEFGDIDLTLVKNGSVEAKVKGKDVMDHQLDTIAWLANTLFKYGGRLRAGHRVMSGSFTKPAPVEQGDEYEATFSGIGIVRMGFD